MKPEQEKPLPYNVDVIIRVAMEREALLAELEAAIKAGDHAAEHRLARKLCGLPPPTEH